jgi:hypothetical protein
MIRKSSRKLLQSALCIFLAPLLAAQQTADTAVTPIDHKPTLAPEFVTLDKGHEVHLLLLEDISSATATKGQRVRMAMAEDVIVDGKIVIPKGTKVQGEVSGLTKAISGKRDGYIHVTPLNLTLSDGGRLKLGDLPPGEDKCGDFGPCWAPLLFLAPLVPLILIRVAVGADHLKQPGIDGTEHICSLEFGYTVNKTKLRVLDARNMNASAPTSADIANCAHSVGSQPLR